MFGIAGISFGVRFAGFEFGSVETVLLVVAVATALVSAVELIRLSSREHLQQRVAGLRGAIAGRAEPERMTDRAPWYDRLGALLAQSPLVGQGEQDRLAAKLALAGIGGPGRVATFIAIRFLVAVVGGAAAWRGFAAFDTPPEAAVLQYFAVAFGLMVGWRLPDLALNTIARRRKLRLEMGFPDALDLLVICAEAGLGLEQAIGQVAHDLRRATPDVAAEFALTAAEMRVVPDRRVALDHLAARTGLETLQGMIAILNQSAKFGTPLSESLRQLTAEARMVRIFRMEERGARLSVTLLLPVMLFVLPSLFLVIGGPIVLRAIDTFSGVMGGP
jgi:tight adherence protein C